MSYTISPKKILFLILNLAFIAGCSSGNHGNEQIQSKAKNQVQINWIANWFARESKKKIIVEAAKEFEFLNQEVKINIKFQEQLCNNCSDVLSAMQDSIAQMVISKHYNWDIITLTQKNYSEVGKLLNDPEWGKKYLVNFNEFDWFRESHKPIVFEVKQYRDDLGGIFAGPLIEGRYFSLWYNAELANKIGLHIKQIGMTFDDFAGYLKQTYEYNKTAGEKIQLFCDKSTLYPAPELLNSLVLSALGNVDTLKIDISKSLASLKRVFKACESISIYNLTDQSIKIEGKADGMLEGKALFGVNVSSYINNWEAIDKEKAKNMVPAELPIFEKPGMYFHGSYQSVWAVFKDAPNRDEAIKFMKFMCSQDIAEKWISNTKNPTAIKVRMNVSELSHDEISKFNSEIEKKYGNNIRNFNIARILFGTKTKITLDVSKILKGQISADEYYNEILKQLRK
jgi:ABC-type glycerol-3-phosphate transport system substrate-binding protein